MTAPSTYAAKVPAGTTGASHSVENTRNFTGFIPTQTFYFSFFYKADRVSGSGSVTIRAQIDWFTTAGAAAGTTYNDITIATSAPWTFREDRHMAPANAASGRVKFIITPATTPIQHDVYVTAARVAVSERGATLGATWGSDIDNIPANLASLVGTEAILNQAILDSIASDEVLAVQEKIGPLAKLNADLQARYTDLAGRASALGISTTAAANARSEWTLALDRMGDGPNQFGNPGFGTASTSEWTLSTPANASLSASSGRLTITNNASGGSYAYRAFTTQVGKRYRVRGTMVSEGHNGRVYVGTSIGGNQYGGIVAPGTLDLFFVATGTTAYITVGDAITASSNSVYDDFHFSEALPAWNDHSGDTRIYTHAFADRAFPSGWTLNGAAAVANGIYTTLTDDSTTVYEHALRSTAQAAAATQYSGGLLVKKDSIGRATRFPMLRLNATGGTAKYVDFMLDTATGEFSTSTNGQGAADAYGVLDLGDEWLLWGTFTTNANNTAIQAEVYPAVGASAAWAYGVAATGSIDCRPPLLVKGDSHELGRAMLTGRLYAFSAEMAKLAVAISEAAEVLIEWSANGISDWHSGFQTGDLYMRQSTDNGATWSAAARVVGEDGAPGADGNYRQTVFKRSLLQPATPIGNGPVPSGWTDGPTGTSADGSLWMSAATLTAGHVLVGSWSAPVQISATTSEELAPGAKTYARTWDEALTMAADLSGRYGYALQQNITGGAGKPVFKVDNVSMDATVSGSLLWAIAQANAGTGGQIIFSTDGPMRLFVTKNIVVNGANITIDAPGRNVTIVAPRDINIIRMGNDAPARADNIILRRLKFDRVGRHILESGDPEGKTPGDAINAFPHRCNKIWIDQCTVSGNDDGCIDFAASTALPGATPCYIEISRCKLRSDEKVMLLGSTAPLNDPAPSWAPTAVDEPRILYATLYENYCEGTAQRHPRSASLAYVHSVGNVMVLQRKRREDGVLSAAHGPYATTGGHILSERDLILLGSPDTGVEGTKVDTAAWNDTTNLGPGALKTNGTVALDSLPINTANTGKVANPVYSYTLPALPADTEGREARINAVRANAGAEIRPIPDGQFNFVAKATGDAEGLYVDGVRVLRVRGGYLKAVSDPTSPGGVGNIIVEQQPDIVILADSTGTVKTGELPRTVAMKATDGTQTLTTLGSWSLSATPGVTATIGASTGVISVTALTVSEAELTATFIYSGISRTAKIKVRRQDDAASGGGGTSSGTGYASTATIGNASSTGYNDANSSTTLKVTAGAAGSVTCRAPLNYKRVSGATSGGITNVTGKWQWRVVGGSWADIATEVQATSSAEGFYDAESGTVFEAQGSISVTMTKTGLTNGTAYEFRFQWKRGSGQRDGYKVSGTMDATVN